MSDKDNRGDKKNNAFGVNITPTPQKTKEILKKYWYEHWKNFFEGFANET